MDGFSRSPATALGRGGSALDGFPFCHATAVAEGKKKFFGLPFCLARIEFQPSPKSSIW
ncbi:hypothetical protein [Scytonema sp. NUACC21]